MMCPKVSIAQGLERLSRQTFDKGLRHGVGYARRKRLIDFYKLLPLLLLYSAQ
jgi:hypothetical protein